MKLKHVALAMVGALSQGSLGNTSTQNLSNTSQPVQNTSGLGSGKRLCEKGGIDTSTFWKKTCSPNSKLTELPTIFLTGNKSTALTLRHDNIQNINERCSTVVTASCASNSTKSRAGLFMRVNFYASDGYIFTGLELKKYSGHCREIENQEFKMDTSWSLKGPVVLMSIFAEAKNLTLSMTRDDDTLHFNLPLHCSQGLIFGLINGCGFNSSMQNTENVCTNQNETSVGLNNGEKNCNSNLIPFGEKKFNNPYCSMEEYSTETNKYEYLKSRLRSTGLYELERTDNILSTLAINITKISQCTPTGVVVDCVPKLPFSDDGFTIIKTDALYIQTSRSTLSIALGQLKIMLNPFIKVCPHSAMVFFSDFVDWVSKQPLKSRQLLRSEENLSMRFSKDSIDFSIKGDFGKRFNYIFPFQCKEGLIDVNLDITHDTPCRPTLDVSYLNSSCRTLNNSNGSYIYNDSNENKTHWPWPFILIGAGTSIVVLVIINEIKKCVLKNQEPRNSGGSLGTEMEVGPMPDNGSNEPIEAHQPVLPPGSTNQLGPAAVEPTVTHTTDTEQGPNAENQGPSTIEPNETPTTDTEQGLDGTNQSTHEAQRNIIDVKVPEQEPRSKKTL